MLFPDKIPIRVALVVLLGSGGLAAQQLPTGFVDELVLGGLSQPVGLDLLPDGRKMIVEQLTGRVIVATVSTSAVVGVVPNVVSTQPEQGLLGIAVDPLWPTRPYIYLMYNHDVPASVRVVRYSFSGDLTDPQSTTLSMGSPYYLIDNIPDAAAYSWRRSAPRDS